MKLNLGRFDQCVSYLKDGAVACYLVSKGQKVSYFMNHGGDIASTKFSVVKNYKGYITIPTFDIGVAVDHGRIDDYSVVEQLLFSIEIEIFSMIRKIISEHGGCSSLENIMIPIVCVKVFDDDRNHGSYGWAEVGIAVISD